MLHVADLGRTDVQRFGHAHITTVARTLTDGIAAGVSATLTARGAVEGGPMRLRLVDLDAGLVEHWRRAFAGVPDVMIQCGDILSVASGTLVSPANGQGHMDGGIDRAYIAWLGAHVQRAVYDVVARRPEGMIPVGAAELVATRHIRIPWLIVAPTMDVPELVTSSNCYRAMRAALRVAERHADRIDKIYCPGLGTGIGGVSASDAAQAMADAYRASLVARP